MIYRLFSTRQMKALISLSLWILFVPMVTAESKSQAGTKQGINTAISQVNDSLRAGKVGRKGEWSIYWGWNRESYTRSDIYLKTENAEFTLYDVVAHDKQNKFGLDPHFNPVRLTVPQTNFKLGYFISDQWELAIGFDHMKYVMDQDQTVEISGYIEETDYDHSEIVLSRSFLKFEHTDGLNYIYSSALWHSADLPRIWSKLDANFMMGGGIGILRPRTDVTFQGVKGPNEYHVSGYGLHLTGGIRLSLFNHFTLRSEIKGGYIDMPNIQPTKGPHDQASQKFYFLQGNIMIGMRLAAKPKPYLSKE